MENSIKKPFNYSDYLRNDFISTLESLDAEKLSYRLKFLSMYITVYENFKQNIVDNLVDFFDKNYDKKVLSKIQGDKNKQIRATIEFYLENGAISLEDKKCFKHITDQRNNYAHSMFGYALTDISDEDKKLFNDMIDLYKKIDRWWFKNVEIEIQLAAEEITREEYHTINWDGVNNSSIKIMEVIYEIAVSDGNTKMIELLQLLKNGDH